MIILQTGFFHERDSLGNIIDRPKRLIVSCAFHADTMKAVIVQNVPPEQIPGAYYHKELNEWVID
jgi:hypothetical protein